MKTLGKREKHKFMGKKKVLGDQGRTENDQELRSKALKLWKWIRSCLI